MFSDHFAHDATSISTSHFPTISISPDLANPEFYNISPNSFWILKQRFRTIIGALQDRLEHFYFTMYQGHS